MKSLKIIFFMFSLVFSGILCSQQIKKAKQESEKVPKTAESLVCIALKKAVKIAVQTNNRASLDVLPEELRVLAYLLYNSITGTDPNYTLLQLLNRRNVGILKNCNIELFINSLKKKADLISVNIYTILSARNMNLSQGLAQEVFYKTLSRLFSERLHINLSLAEVIHTLINAGANVNAQFENDQTVLIMIAKEIDKLNTKPQSTLQGVVDMIALINEYFEIIQILMQHNLDLNAQDAEGNTALMYLVRTIHPTRLNQQEPFDILLFLLAKSELNINLTNKIGENALLYFLHYLPNYLLLKNVYYIVQKLIDAGIDVNVQDKKNGFTPLMRAAFAGDLTIIEKLLKAGAQINLTDQSGGTALTWAILGAQDEFGQNKPEYLKKYEAIITYLINSGADVFYPDSGSTALDYATSPELIEFLEKLIKEQEKK